MLLLGVGYLSFFSLQALTYSNKLLGAPEGFLAGGGSDPVAEAFTKRLTMSGVSITSLESQKSKEELDKYFLKQGSYPGLPLPACVVIIDVKRDRYSESSSRMRVH